MSDAGGWDWEAGAVFGLDDVEDEVGGKGVARQALVLDTDQVISLEAAIDVNRKIIEQQTTELHQGPATVTAVATKVP